MVVVVQMVLLVQEVIRLAVVDVGGDSLVFVEVVVLVVVVGVQPPSGPQGQHLRPRAPN